MTTSLLAILCATSVSATRPLWTVAPTNAFTQLVIRNCGDTSDEKDVSSRWAILRNGTPYAAGEFALDGLKPDESAVFDLPPIVREARARGGCIALHVRFLDKDEVVARASVDFPFAEAEAFEGAEGEVAVREGKRALVCEANGVKFSVNRATGLPLSVRTEVRSGVREFLRRPMTVVVPGADPFVGTLKEMKHETQSNGMVRVTTVGEWKGANALAFDARSVWTVAGDGKVMADVRIRPTGGERIPSRVGICFEMPEENPPVRWFSADSAKAGEADILQSTPEAFFDAAKYDAKVGNAKKAYGVSIGELTFRAVGDAFVFETIPYSPSEIRRAGAARVFAPSRKAFVVLYAAPDGKDGNALRFVLSTDDGDGLMPVAPMH